MTRRAWVISAIAAVISLAVAFIVVQQRDGRQRDQPPGEVALISFTETVQADAAPEQDRRIDRKVSIHVSHRDGRIAAMRFITRSNGGISEERRWEATDPRTVTIRTWDDCRQLDDEMPPPAPETLEIVLAELFGPRAIPADARTTGEGKSHWKVEQGLVTSEFTDGGGTYPDRKVTIRGPEGDVGSIITGGSVEAATELPGWAPGWESCAAGR
ncbi:hypothetical protein [Streptomyces gobiensis]|uniref:hypothetical protein n=1 Tax=Streptomyces gobiensis TaxID=2875706 RepID=UPI001E55AEF4|nr:hypothetical protein [Streptomyces gobiensis]UGY93123.1 hypothetical protein test1122_16340 [Streptomyces gobiensis]